MELLIEKRTQGNVIITVYAINGPSGVVEIASCNAIGEVNVVTKPDWVTAEQFDAVIEDIQNSAQLTHGEVTILVNGVVVSGRNPKLSTIMWKAGLATLAMSTVEISECRHAIAYIQLNRKVNSYSMEHIPGWDALPRASLMHRITQCVGIDHVNTIEINPRIKVTLFNLTVLEITTEDGVEHTFGINDISILELLKF